MLGLSWSSWKIEELEKPQVNFIAILEETIMIDYKKLNNKSWKSDAISSTVVSVGKAVTVQKEKENAQDIARIHKFINIFTNGCSD